MQSQSNKNTADMKLLLAPLSDTFCSQFLPTLLQELQCHQVFICLNEGLRLWYQTVGLITQDIEQTCKKQISRFG